jgi:hypothetical protein
MIIVRVRECARGRPRWVGVSAGRGRALVSRLHGGSGGGVDLGERVEPQLNFGSLGGGGTGERVEAAGARCRRYKCSCAGRAAAKAKERCPT